MVGEISTAGTEVIPYRQFAPNTVAFGKEVIMPVKVKKVDGYRVTHGGKVSAKHTTKAKAQAQANLLRGIKHGWKPTGKPKKKKKK